MSSKPKKPVRDKTKTWSQVVDLKKKAFKDQGIDKFLHFEETIETDRVGIFIIKQNVATTRKKSVSR